MQLSSEATQLGVALLSGGVVVKLIEGAWAAWRGRQAAPAALTEASAIFQRALSDGSRALIEDLRAELKVVRGRCDTLEAKVDACEERHAACEAETRKLLERITLIEAGRVPPGYWVKP